MSPDGDIHSDLGLMCVEEEEEGVEWITCFMIGYVGDLLRTYIIRRRRGTHIHAEDDTKKKQPRFVALR